jgi:UDP-glucose 4-epimerase
MRILVTGGTGFIGSYLVNRLIELGHNVVIMDSNEKKNRNENAEFVKGDIRDAFDVRKAMQGCEIVYHLAAIADVRAGDDLMYAVNFLGAKNVFEVAKSKNAKVVFASSAAVYGNGRIPNKEQDDCNPVSQYGKSKLRAERYLQQLMAEHFILRLFNVYGPGGRSVINIFAKNIINFQDIVVYGNGNQARDYVYISDIVDAFILGLSNTGLYNVGTGSEYSLTYLIDFMHETTRCKPTVKFTLAQENDIGRSKADTTKIRELGWAPKIGLEEGIRLVLESCGWKPL